MTLKKTIDLAKNAHKRQVRKFSNEEYFSHLKAVAKIIRNLTWNKKLIKVSYLHDIIEDTKYTFKDLFLIFGQDIANLVLSLTNDKNLIKKMGKKFYMADKCLQMSNQALTVKLADRLHNIMSLRHKNTLSSFKEKVYTNTLYILETLKNSKRKMTIHHKILIHRIHKNIHKKCNCLNCNCKKNDTTI